MPIVPQDPTNCNPGLSWAENHAPDQLRMNSDAVLFAAAAFDAGAEACQRDRNSRISAARRAEALKATNCPSGHSFDEKNTGWYVNRGTRVRYCRKCASLKRGRRNR